jgi:hypothetical protein
MDRQSDRALKCYPIIILQSLCRLPMKNHLKVAREGGARTSYQAMQEILLD